MQIQKIFHVHQSLQETQNLLAAVPSYRRHLSGITKATICDGVAQLRFEPGLGYTINVELTELADKTPNRILFRSTHGNIELAGMVEFFAIREQLTEVVLTIDYQLSAPLAGVVDNLTHVMERFLELQLRGLQSHFEGVGTIASHSAGHFSGVGLTHSAA